MQCLLVGHSGGQWSARSGDMRGHTGQYEAFTQHTGEGEGDVTPFKLEKYPQKIELFAQLDILGVW